MKLLKPFNLIMIVLIPIIMFFGFSLRSYANGVFNYTFQIKHSSTSYSDNNHNCTIDLSGSPIFTISRDTNSISYSGDYINATLKATTSEGTFDIKSSTTYISSNTSSSNLGFDNLGSITLPGYFINLYVDYSSGKYKGGDYSGTENGSTYSGTGGNSYNGNEFGTFTSTYDMARISAIGNSSYGSFTNGVFSDNGDYPTIFYTSSVYFPFGTDLSNMDNTYFRLNMNIPRSTFNISSTSFDFIKIDLYSILANGDTVLLDSYFDTPSNFNNISSSTVLFSGTSKSMQFDYSATGFYFAYTLYGIRDKVISNSSLLYPLVSYTIFNKNSLNVIDTREQSDWSTIGESDELSDLSDTSTSIEDTLADNNTFEESAFTSLDNSLADFDFDTWSLVPAENGIKVASYFINSFYNHLPYKVQWLITSVIAFGLISMLLTVGTRVIQRTGEFTRARPVRVSERHIYHHKSK